MDKKININGHDYIVYDDKDLDVIGTLIIDGNVIADIIVKKD